MVSVVGIDIGSSSSFVAFVGKGNVDIVQNEVSNRATPSLVGFHDRERLLGDPALALIKSNLKNTCRNFKHIIGRKTEHADVQQENFWSTSPLANSEHGFAGYDVNYKGEGRIFSAEQVTAMYLTKLRDISEKWCQAKVNDAVICVPSYFTDVHRRAMLDAAKIAGLTCLRIMNEHTATALAYGIYRSAEFDPEKPTTVAFCSLGHTIFSVAIVQFVKGKLNVLCEKSDKTGGRDMDECLMREFAARFKKKFGCDPLSNKKALYKLEDAVAKTKKTLSANNEAGINVECLMEDEDFASTITRQEFEEMCKPMMSKVSAVLDAAKAASGISVEQVDFVEMVGGAHRVPFIKQMCSDAFGGKDLSFTMNAEESVARGCALQAAILSPLYKVRDFLVQDTTPFGIQVGWKGTADAAADAEADETQAEAGTFKTATVFPAGSAMNTVKMLTFFRKEPFDITAEYLDPSLLDAGTSKELGVYRIELPPQTESKKVKVKAKLTIHGTFQIDGAMLVEEEEYTETVKEKRELPPDPAAAEAEAPAPAAPPAEGEAAAAEAPAEKPKPPEKKYEYVEVQKTKKRTKQTDLKIVVSGKPGYTETDIQKRSDEETAMQAEMRDIIETDEKRNDLESYIFEMRDKTSESGTYGAFMSAADREKFSSDLMKAEDWLYDNMEGTKVQFVEKHNELKATGDAVIWRCKEDGMRQEWVDAVSGTVKNYRAAAESPGDKYGHIAPEKLTSIMTACDALAGWLNGMIQQQAAKQKYERPVLLCADMEKKNQELAKMADEILREPKPAPPKEEKKEEAPKEGDAAAAPAEAPQSSAADVD